MAIEDNRSDAILSAEDDGLVRREDRMCCMTLRTDLVVTA
jgi:hypothetical protein